VARICFKRQGSLDVEAELDLDAEVAAFAPGSPALVFPETGHWRAGHPKTCETQQAHSLVNLLALQLTETHPQFLLQ
jgi:hypothetical protein